MKVEARVPREPSADLGMLVGGVVIDNQVQVQIRRGLAVDLIEEADELLVPVSAHALADHPPIQHVEGGEQGRRAVALIVVRYRLGAPGSHGQSSGVTLTLGSPSAIAGVLAVVVVRLGKGGISRSVRDRQTSFSSSRHLRARGIETESFVSAGPLEWRLAAFPTIAVPTITLEGDANGAPHPDASAYAKKFPGKYEHRTITGRIGHNLPQEAPQAFAQAVID